MAVRWTEDQSKAIELRNRDLLVSAAAGSGKTAVLAERIAREAADPEHPLSMDRILVVTFTKAAASEMKERVTKALAEKLAENPESAVLRRQLTLVREAKITTIDSFCLSVLKEQYAKIGLDPSFRIADEGEIRLIREDVLQDLIERKLREKDEDFLWFFECCNPGKDDTRAQNLVLGLSSLAEANPRPEDWLVSCRKIYQITEPKDLLSSEFVQKYCDEISLLLREYGETEERLAETARQKSAALKAKEAGGAQTENPSGGKTGKAGKAKKTKASPSEKMADLADILQFEARQMQSASEARGFEALSASLKSIAYQRKPAVNKDEEGHSEADTLWGERNAIKKMVDKERDGIFGTDPEELLRRHRLAAKIALPLIDLTLEYLSAFQSEKRRRRILDFSDVEHLALQIFSEKKNGKEVPTETAGEYADRFDEIMIDEYQDSNRIQELILSSISGDRKGRPNRFMVGDVKQSIYRFRLARPELFTEKYSQYTLEDSDHQKVGLSRNFRSRGEILTAVNYLFYCAMHSELGGIEYTEDQALYQGAVYPEAQAGQEGRAGGPVRLILMDPGSAPERSEKDAEEEDSADPELSGNWGASRGSADTAGGPDERQVVSAKAGEETDGTAEDGEASAKNGSASHTGRRTARELEAALAAREILKMTDPDSGTLVKGSDGSLRPARYGDIVILLRAMNGWADNYVSVLREYGIPAAADSGTGYFSSREVKTTISMLKIISNPVQDIPLAAVLRSPVGGFSSEELAKIHLAAPKDNEDGLYGELKAYAAAGGNASAGKDTDSPEAGLAQKTAEFLAKLDHFREEAGVLPLHEFLDRLLTETGYAEYAASLPGSERRTANLAMLMKRAEEFESTSYSGLFEFVRYLERLNRYNIDFPEASAAGTENIVHVMSIHKSKGLEFPIVILAGAGKKFNRQDSRASVILHPDYGVAANAVDCGRRTKAPGLMKQLLARDLELQNLGEELRVLYVAMTRAKEQLVITGTVRNLWDWIRKTLIESDPASRRLSFRELSGASSYLDWILAAFAKNRCSSDLWTAAAAGQPEPGELFSVNAGFAIETVDAGELETSDQARSLDREYLSREIIRAVSAPEKDGEGDTAASRLSEDSHYDDMYRLPSSVSVSEIKMEHIEAMREDELILLDPKNISGTLPEDGKTRDINAIAKTGDAAQAGNPAEILPPRPAFMRPAEPLSGARRGTVYHYLLQHLKPESGRPLDEQARKLVSRGLITEQEFSAVRLDDLEIFYRSDLGQRSRRAAQAGTLHTEYPFCLGLRAGEIFEGRYREGGPDNLRIDPDALVEIHGIIDAWFTENGRIILYDYKTDHIGGDGWEEELTERYRVQLELYARALQAMTGRPVSEIYLYSIPGRKALPVPVPESFPGAEGSSSESRRRE
ncbi:MAG: UvrD-helicase domain-containing protein [Lachnospiraceae bacterium]|jgi:ATP-dependent helicase/nuclease subunit A